jgi:HD-like signal output (HDOD) protein
MTTLSRLRQTYDHLRPDQRRPPTLPDEIRSLLTNRMQAHFRSLAPGDQRHLLTVYRLLRAAGADEDTYIAGLLHDVGKTDGTYRVRVADRIARVVLNRCRPHWLTALAKRPTAPPFLRGLHLAVCHAALGAELAADCGYNHRIVDLIRRHESRDHASDRQLAMLVAADDAADSSSTHYT